MEDRGRGPNGSRVVDRTALTLIELENRGRFLSQHATDHHHATSLEILEGLRKDRTLVELKATASSLFAPVTNRRTPLQCTAPRHIAHGSHEVTSS